MPVETEIFDPARDYRRYDIVPYDEVPPEVQLVPIINKTLVKCKTSGQKLHVPPERDGGKRKTFVIHPSQAAGCRRKVFFTVVDAQKDRRPLDPELERIFAMGHMAHQRIQGYLFSAWAAGIDGVNRVWEDVKLKVPDIGASGELDAIIQVLRHRYLIEIKTCSDSVYKRQVKPKNDWVYQSHIYMKGVGLKGAILLMENRNNGHMKQHWIPWCDETWDQIEDDSLEVLVSIEERVVPRKTDDRSECYWCDYTEICKSQRLQGKIDYDRVQLPVVA